MIARDTFRDPWQDLLVRLAVIAFTTLWIYSPVCSPTQPAEWLWDDNDLLTGNLTVQHRLSADPAVPPAHLATLGKLWLDPDGLDYFPLTSTALWAQWPFFSMDPRTGGIPQADGFAVAWPPGFHTTSVLLHMFAAILLWRLLAIMRLPGAWLGGLLFAVHPVCVESVAWVSELKNTLSMPLFLIAATDYVRFDDAVNRMVHSVGPADIGRARVHYAVAVVCFLLAMLAKTSMVAFPVVVLLYVWWKRGAVKSGDLARAAPLFLISLALGIVTLSFQHGRAIGEEKIPVGGLVSRMATAGMSIGWYLKLLAWPENLLPIYPRWQVDPPQAWQFLPWVGMAAITWGCWRHRATWGRHVLFSFGFFLLMLAPVLGFVTISYMRITWVADHFVYLPMIGLVGLVAAWVGNIYERTPAREQPRIVAATAAVLALLAILSFRYAACWINEDVLWTHTLARNDSAWQAHNRLGVRKLARGRIEDIEPAAKPEDFGAMHHFLRATALRPDLGETHNNLGTGYLAQAKAAARRGDKDKAASLIDAAIGELAEACRLASHASHMRDNFLNMLAATGRFGDLAAAARGFLERNPNDVGLLNTYGVALHRAGSREQAMEQYRKVLAIDPGNRDARENLAAALEEKSVLGGALPPPPDDRAK